MSEATERPKLKLEHSETHNIRWLEDENRQTVCDFFFDEDGHGRNLQIFDNAEEWAERIVHAVNSIEELEGLLGEAGAKLKQAIELLAPFDDPGLSLGLGENVLPEMNDTLTRITEYMEKRNG